MFWTILALLLWITLGGFISYYGDLQGRRWGKRRVSWFGLRPKHTAILITSLTGGLIALLSIGTLILIVPTVREVVLHGEAAIHENERVIADKKRQQIDFNRRVADLQNRYALIKAQIADLLPRLAEKQHELDRKQHELEGLNQKYQSMQAKLAQAETEVAQLNRQKGKLIQEKKQLAQDNSRSTDINNQLARQNFRLARQNDEYEKTNTDLQKKNAGLEANIADLTRKRDAIAQELATSNMDLEKMKASYEALQDAYAKQIATEEQRKAALEAENTELKHQQDDLYTQLAGTGRNSTQTYLLRQGRINLRAGAELARRTIADHERPEKVRRDLLQLLQDASQTAAKYGAVRGDNGREVQIIRKRVVTAAGVEEANEDTSLAALVGMLAGSDAPIVVVVNAVYNHVEGEQILVELRPYVVAPLFDKGETIASRRLDARQSVNQIMETVLGFLQKEVRDAAVQQGAIPRTDPETGAPEVGSMGMADLFALAERVHRKGGTVQLTAVAKSRITSADTLNLDFRIARVSDEKS